jgi:hypothetical protein
LISRLHSTSTSGSPAVTSCLSSAKYSRSASTCPGVLPPGPPDSEPGCLLLLVVTESLAEQRRGEVHLDLPLGVRAHRGHVRKPLRCRRRVGTGLRHGTSTGIDMTSQSSRPASLRDGRTSIGLRHRAPRSSPAAGSSAPGSRTAP